jgi:hypothetical protein
VNVVINKVKTVAAKIVHKPLSPGTPTLAPSRFPTNLPTLSIAPGVSTNTIAPGTGVPSFFHNTSRVYGQCRFAEAYPSAGGPDCYKQCKKGERSYSYKLYSMPWQLKLKMEWARSRIRRKYGYFNQAYRWHMSFVYLCCYNSTEMKLIKEAVAEQKRQQKKKGPLAAVKVTFDRIVCRVDSSKPTPHVSFILLADEQSNRRMQKWAADFEATIAAKGVAIKSPRRDVQPFHITIGWMQNAHTPNYKYAAALEDVNKHGHIHKWPAYYPRVPHLNSWATDGR